ncbi:MULTISPECIES: multidrug effflux MFS transporter [Enterococcus]|uniref:multidrug effflux MFS transporter n=1 Tax=Enterococcus TaxID=1350 RepID=UPI0022E037F2|nr:multidrug effflux MFS transporter [Enterococcus thailandicus]MDT2750695.1 multidrug effflux MFS transporter [Enterococcus thailandicus]MDT2775254.1 multidrug effflux MFS transporter [Enterococcus thailandicus]MDT2793751.1 multidrug effflux MFS transporter [Enterococcus thailandicus]
MIENKKKIWWLSILLGTLSAYGPLLLDTYLPALPVLETDFGIPTSMVQLSLTMCLAGLAFGPLFIGAISDRIGRKKPLLWGIGISVIACLLSVSVTNIWLFLSLRLIQGIASSTGVVLTRAIAKDLFSGTQLTRFIAMLMAINGIFPIVSPLLGSFFLSYFSWRVIFIFLAVIGLLLFLGILIGFKETHEVQLTTEKVDQRAGWQAVFSDRPFMMFVLIQGFVYAAMFCYISGSSFMLQNVFGLSDKMFSLIYGINGIGIVVAAELAGVLSKRMSSFRQLGWGVGLGFLGSILVIISGIHTNHLWLALLGLLLVVSTLGLVNAVVTTMAMERQGKHAGIASSVLGLGMYAIGMVFTPLVGIMGSNTYLPLAVLIFISEACAVILYRMLGRDIFSKEKKKSLLKN